MDYAAELQKLENQKKGDISFQERLDIEDKILDLKYKAGLKEKPKHSYFQCIGCGS